MRAEVLGPVRLERDGREVAFPAGQVGTLLQLLLLQPNRPVPSGELIEELWPAAEPLAARRRLQVTVSRLRKLIGPGREPPGDSLAIEARAGSYRLVAGPAALDRVAFEALVAQAGEGRDVAVAEQALALWRDEPYTGLPLSPLLRRELDDLHSLRRRLFEVGAVPADPEQMLRRVRLRPSMPVGAMVRRTVLDKLPNVGAVQVLAVSAPVGYGKSSLLAQWAADQQVSVAWLTLGEADNDLARFWTAVMESLTVGIGPEVAERAGDVRAGSTAFFDALGVIVDPLDQGFALVLDDLHVITNPQVLDGIQQLAEALSPSSTLALGTRVAPPLLRSTAELAGRVVTVSAPQLRFTVPEVAELLGGDQAAARRLWSATEGWPAATVAIHRSGADLTSGQRVVDDFVSDAVLRQLPAEVLDLVLQMAHLDEFNVDLCEAVTGRSDVGQALDWLRAHGLFVIESDPRAGPVWCRFHPVVADTARRHGAHSVNVSRILRRAARWCRDHGLDEEALSYAVHARDRSLVAETAGDVLLESALRGEAERCARWLQRIDPEDLASDPRAHGVGVYLAAEWLNVDDRSSWLRSRRRHFGGSDDVALLLVDAIEAMRSGRSTSAVALSEEVMERCLDYSAEHAPDLGPLMLGSAFSNLLRARVFQGAVSADDPIFPSAIALIRPHVPLLAAWVHASWGLVAVVDGDHALAVSLAEEFYQGRRPKELGRPVGRDNSLLGALLAARQATTSDGLLRLAEGVEDLPGMFDAKGQHTEGAVALLIVASLFRRAGAADRAAPFQRRADVLLLTFEDAPLLLRLRDHLIDLEGDGRSRTGLTERLTDRQRTIVDLLRTELSSQEIAAELHISHHTLRTHLREIYKRLEVHSRLEAVLLFEASGALGGPRGLSRGRETSQR